MSGNCEVITRHFADDGVIPNNPGLAVVILRGALDPGLGAPGVQRVLAANGWGGGWVWTVFDYHHWHPDAHEALSVSAGTAELMLGGPTGERFTVSAGDTLILPAGTGHCRLSSSPDFEVCGAYPPGQERFETRRGRPEDRGDGPALIARVPLPATDPVFGADGPLMTAWRR
ncbi:cupin domain-containing protein [Oceanicella sp. SM1341]|uniref:cupin domain-containing protein n=1 Tax=Oceanicella sp. SM1341 TaxID=1548889 RepID=UPI000E53152F|nr:cupin domain-containing protein [Oceanicella sp. SM1341]